MYLAPGMMQAVESCSKTGFSDLRVTENDAVVVDGNVNQSKHINLCPNADCGC